MFALDETFLRTVAPSFADARRKAEQDRIIGAIAPVFAATLDRYGIDTLLRIAHFMGQVTVECAGFATTEEYDDGRRYEGRLDLGNTEPGDGPLFKGRGLLQLTGRANYRRMGAVLGLPLEQKPAIAADPLVSLAIACEYWKAHAINLAADQDDLVRVTRKVNGGSNGIGERATFLKKAKAALLALAASPAIAAPVLHRGLSSDVVGRLQAALRGRGYPIAIDNDFGAATELAVKTFQAKAHLAADGIVGPATWAALGTARGAALGTASGPPLGAARGAAPAA